MSTDAASSASAPAALKPFRIFLASPGDVAHERLIVREVLDQLRMERRFRDRLAPQLIAWDQPGAAVAMQAGITPQEAIARGLPLPAACDLAVVIFWSRMGTILPAAYTKPDGSRFLSGTEWEYCNAMEGFRSKGRPDVWLFHRQPAPKMDLDDPKLEEAREQLRQVDAFFRAVYNPDGSIGGGIQFYGAPDEFRRQFEHLLRDHLEAVVSAMEAAAPAQTEPHAVSGAPTADEAEPAQAAQPPLYQGAPYPGLAAFTPEQAPVFFGRGAEIDQLLTVLADPAVRFVAVVGLSGSGKSSLVAAGLIPRLRDGLIGGAAWRDLRFTPAERGPNPFLALAAAVKEALPADGGTVADLAADLRAEPGRIAMLAERLLNGRPNGAELLLYIDQFEELFTQADPALIPPFVGLIARAAETPRVRVVATMRADFYAAAIAEQGLAALLRRDRGSFPLDPPGVAALAAIIERPARAAGLDLEDGLVEQIVKDAFGSPGSGDGPGGGPGTLALTAFALRELYEQRRRSRDGGEPLAPGTCLTLNDYEAIGRIEGAVRRRAEETLKRVGDPADAVLDGLFGYLVEVNEQEVATRRRAAKDALPAPARPLADALTDARLLTAGRGADDRPTVELAHETLLRAWPRLADWVRDHADALRARRDLQRAAKEWDASRRSGDALRGGAVLKRYRNAPGPRTPLASDYLSACSRRQWRNRVLGSAGIAVLVAGLAVWNHVNRDTGYTPWMMTKGLLVELGLGRLPGPFRLLKDPDMVPIKGGRFDMGDSAGGGFDDERPVHPRQVADFWIGRYEVTFDEYDLFAAATGRARPSDEKWGRGKWPVINVSWEDADAYATWLAEHTHQPYRLPSEAEWEYAARGGTKAARWFEETEGADAEPCRFINGQDRSFDESGYWADATKQAMATQGLYDPLGCSDGYAFTAPVDADGFAPHPRGLHHIIGNVWEWVADCAYAYADAPEDARAVTDKSDAVESKNCAGRVLRGGSWGNAARSLRASVRNGNTPDFAGSDIGLRLARSN